MRTISAFLFIWAAAVYVFGPVAIYVFPVIAAVIVAALAVFIINVWDVGR